MSTQNKLMESPNFTDLNIPLPELINSYPLDKQIEIYNYLKELDDQNKKAYLIALDHLGSSFNIYKSNGFKDWKSKKD
jgi:hypothetical protein